MLSLPLLKALMCGINAVGAQGCSCMSTFCHAPLKIALLLHKMANGPYSFSETVCKISFVNFNAIMLRKQGEKRLSPDFLRKLFAEGETNLYTE